MITQAEMQAISEAVGIAIATAVKTAKDELRAEFETRSMKPVVDVEAIAERAAALVPAGKNGENGKDAPPVDIDSIVLRAAELIPKPADGKDGQSGRDGVDGKDGAPGRDGADGKNGIDGERGQQGERGLPGESIKGDPGDAGDVGPAGPQGERGISIIGERGEKGEAGPRGEAAVLPDLEPIVQRVFEAGFSKWAVDTERRAHDVFQRAIDKMPKPVDGKDGFNLEDFTVTDDGEGNVTFTFIRGDLTRSFTVRIPGFLDKGGYDEGGAYMRGNAVSFGNNLWIAQKDNPEGKPGTSHDWRLAVRKPRDGRDGVMKPPRPEGPVKL